VSAARRRDEQEARRADDEARLVAQSEFERPVVVEAGAGTGKTATLVARVVSWALGPGWQRARGEATEEPERIAARVLRRIVAITFTEAAAAEMDERVSQALGEIEAGERPVGLFEQALECSSEERVQRATALRSVLDQLRVHTIHAFCRRLLAEAPLEAGLHPQFEVDADESAQKAIVRDVVETALPELFASDAMLRLMDDGIQVSALEDALLLLQRHGAPPEALDDDPLAVPRVEALLSDLKAPLQRFLTLEAGRLAGVSGAKRLVATVESLARLQERIEALEPVERDTLESLQARLVEEDFSVPTVRKWTKEDFGKKACAELEDDVAALAALAGELLPVLAHLMALDLSRLRDAREVLRPLHEEIWRRLRYAGVETFPSLLRDARELLASQPAVLARVRGQIDQLLVDEFQDTDPVQCAVVRMLALEGPPEQRPGLFLVGDPKQSIYGWRNADLAAYDDFREEVEENGGRVLSLVVNYRSAPAILDEVSRVIAPVMHEQRGLQPAFQELVASEARADDPGFTEQGCAPVEHWVSCEWDARAAAPVETTSDAANRVEARAVAHEIARLHEGGAPWRDFGLLFRAGTNLETYLDELRRAGVPFAVEGDRSYFQRREIIEAGALVRCVLDPNDQLALLTLLRSSVVGVPDAALVPLWARDLPDRMAALHGPDADLSGLRIAVDEAAADVPDEVPGIERVAGWSGNLHAAARSLALLRDSFEQDPADLFVEKLRTLFFFETTEASRYLGAYRLANLDRFFRDLLGVLEVGEGDPQAILRGLREDVAERREHEEGRPREALADAVQISTIHKAKGLAFEHVYLLQLHKGRGNRQESRVEETKTGWEYDLLGARSLGYHRVLRWRARVDACEQVRTLYVAATRARRRLVFASLEKAVARRGPEDSSHAALLAQREGGRPDPLLLMPQLASKGAGASVDVHDARWVFPALRGEPAASSLETRRACLEVADVRATAEALAERRRRAEAQRSLPLAMAISSLAHETAREAWVQSAEQDDEEAGAPAAPRPRRDVAAAVGTAVHALLERVDLAGDLSQELERGREVLEDDLIRELAPPDRKRALAWSREVVEAFRNGPLFERWCELAPHFVSREFGVLLPPDPGAAVGYRSGVVDLLYEDPATGELVVVDYKTDRVEDDAALAEHAARYGPQGEGYVQAVQEGLGLAAPPRFELWFLSAGRIWTD